MTGKGVLPTREAQWGGVGMGGRGGGAVLAGGQGQELPKAEVTPRGFLVAARIGRGGRGESCGR